MVALLHSAANFFYFSQYMVEMKLHDFFSALMFGKLKTLLVWCNKIRLRGMHSIFFPCGGLVGG